MSYKIAEFYLPLDRGNVPVIIPAEDGARRVDSRRDEKLSKLMRLFCTRIFLGEYCSTVWRAKAVEQLEKWGSQTWWQAEG